MHVVRTTMSMSSHVVAWTCSVINVCSCSVKLRIKTSSSQFTPANAPQPQDLPQEEGKVGVANQEKVGRAVEDSVGVVKAGDEQMDTGVPAVGEMAQLAGYTVICDV